jgi:hypothetical protein
MLEQRTGSGRRRTRYARGQQSTALRPKVRTRRVRLPLARSYVGNRINVWTRAAASLRSDGFTLVPGKSFNQIRTQDNYWREFRDAWCSLPVDPYLHVNAPFRFRRYGSWRFNAATEQLSLQPSQPYFQSPDVNPLFGGVAREFAPLDIELSRNPALLSLISYDLDIVQRSIGVPLVDWDVDAHLIRITAGVDEPGEPSPEGIHRDGLDFAAIHLIGSCNVICGSTKLYANRQTELAEVLLRNPLDLLLLNDRLLLHFTAPVTWQPNLTDLTDDGERVLRNTGWRDALLIGFTVGDHDGPSVGFGSSSQEAG